MLGIIRRLRHQSWTRKIVNQVKIATITVEPTHQLPVDLTQKNAKNVGTLQNSAIQNNISFKGRYTEEQTYGLIQYMYSVKVNVLWIHGHSGSGRAQGGYADRYRYSGVHCARTDLQGSLIPLTSKEGKGLEKLFWWTN